MNAGLNDMYLTQEELSKRWKISTATLERDRSLKQGCKYLKIGGRVRYRLSDILAYEESCEVGMAEAR